VLIQNTGNLNVEIQQRAVEYENLFNYDDIRKGVLERMPAPEIREENRVLGESPKKGKARRAQAKQSMQKDLVDILGGGLEGKEPENLIGQQDKNAELLKDLFGPSSPQRSTHPPKSNVSDIMDLFGNGAQGVIPAASPPPALSIGGGGFSSVDELFGRTAEPTPSAKSFGLRLLFLANHSSCGCILQERSYSLPRTDSHGPWESLDPSAFPK
jgi:AP-1 complex subunit gamma-1